MSSHCLEYSKKEACKLALSFSQYDDNVKGGSKALVDWVRVEAIETPTEGSEAPAAKP